MRQSMRRVPAWLVVIISLAWATIALSQITGQGAVAQDSHYSIDDVMTRLDALEATVDDIAAEVGVATDSASADPGTVGLSSRLDSIAGAVGADSLFETVLDYVLGVRQDIAAICRKTKASCSPGGP